MIQSSEIESKAGWGTSEVMHLRFTLENPINHLLNVVYGITHTHTLSYIYENAQNEQNMKKRTHVK